MDIMDKALMMVGLAPGGAFTDEQMKKYREQKISKLAELIPEELSKKKLARWMMDNSSSIIELIEYGDDKAEK